MSIIQRVVPRFRVLEEEMADRDSFYQLPKDVRDAYRLERLNALWLRAATQTRYYADMAREHSLPLRFQSLEEFGSLVPATSREAVRARPDAFKFPEGRRGKWMVTGGSTGVPVRVFWALSGHLESLRDQYWARMWWGVRAFDRQAMLWGHSHSFGHGFAARYHKFMIPMIDRLRRRVRFNAYRLDADSLHEYYDAMVRFRPKSLYAYASAAHLLAVANRGRRPFPASVKVAFMAAEPVIDLFRKSIREVFGCPCAGEYGSIECGMIAYEHPLGMYRIFERSVLVETVPRDTGYEILVTHLRDSGFPLLRYEIGDVTSEPLGHSVNGWDALADVSGRCYEVLRSPSGMVCYGGALTQIIKHLPDVALFAVHQKRDYSLTIRIQTCSGADISAAHRRYVERSIGKILGEAVPVNVQHVTCMERSAAGKHRWITTDLDFPAP